MDAVDQTRSQSMSACAETVLHDLVTPDLAEAMRTGKYDANVLLWMQNRVAAQAMEEHKGALMRFNVSPGQDALAALDVHDKAAAALAQMTNQTYCVMKLAGDGFNLPGYVAAARVFYQTELSLHADHLNDLAVYLRKAVEAGFRPDIERHGCEAYVTMALMSSAIENLEAIGGRDNALEATQWLHQRIEALGFLSFAPELGGAIGRTLLSVVNEIFMNPQKYKQMVNPQHFLSSGDTPWDIDPAMRADDAFLM